MGGLTRTYVEQRRQQFPGFACERLVERREVERLFRADVERPGFGLSDETRRRFNHPRSPDRNEDRADFQSTENTIHPKRRFAEPANMRADLSATRTEGPHDRYSCRRRATDSVRTGS